MKAQHLELLQGMPIFGAIRAESLAFLLEQARERDVAAHGYFFREGEPALHLYVLERGEVTVRKQWQGHQFKLRRLGPGDCFGEMALMDLSDRSASVRAETDCRAIELSPADLLRLFEHDAEQFALIQMNIGREVCRRLRVTDELLFQALMGQQTPALDSVFQSL
ncbi:MAG: Crp/Fnr family transcriptional regulator [Leptothrix sp. (in: b-proteobacteria)]